MLDGQQRITSIGRFVTNNFAILDSNKHEQTFGSLPVELRDKILDTELLVYECEGTEQEIKQWFKTINIAGVPLNDQELLNAVYSGPFVTAAKRIFSDSNNALLPMWEAYVRGVAARQQILEVALEWIAAEKGLSGPAAYMAEHREDTDAAELQRYFDTVLAWAQQVFPGEPDKEMKGLDWGRLYREYGAKAYNGSELRQKASALLADEYVVNKRGVYEYVLGGEQDKQLLGVRFFPESIQKKAYKLQTAAAEDAGVSNCLDCAATDSTRSTTIYKFKEMEADHVTAWSKGGESTLENCQMLCRYHNRLKGNS